MPVISFRWSKKYIDGGIYESGCKVQVEGGSDELGNKPAVDKC